MNQILKEVYGNGTIEQVNFMANIGGMNEEETKLFTLLHYGKCDLFIQEEMGISSKAYKRIEKNVRSKLTIAVMTCINKAMDLEKQKICSGNAIS